MIEEPELSKIKELAVTPLPELLLSLRAKIHYDPLAGDTRVEYTFEGPRPGMVDPLRKYPDVSVLSELERRIPLLGYDGLRNLQDTLEEITHDEPVLGGLYAQGFVRMAFALGRRIEKDFGTKPDST